MPKFDIPSLLIIGNPLLPKDTVQFKVGRVVSSKLSLPIRYLQYPDDLIYEHGYLIDVVKGLTRPRLIGLHEIRLTQSITSHDWDVSQVLRLMDVLGLEPQVKIIGIPYGRTPDDDLISEILHLIEEDLGDATAGI